MSYPLSFPYPFYPLLVFSPVGAAAKKSGIAPLFFCSPTFVLSFLVLF
jgi:hypothetical protein